ncbi:helix-turn-helix domain-containing protein [Stackebrandtia soli]|uniref:helix-turn-helix domain-containing protein n=1 Tax=Stackebrandtia soli TaxID=1892856 RepID=UPI0039E78BE2
MTDRVKLDAAALRVLAHPMRLNLLEHLRRHGPATARQLAAQFELDSGAASYHLRRLAVGGLIHEDTGRGNRRDRWWRATHEQSVHDPTSLPDEQAASREYTQAVVTSYAERLRQVAGQVPVLSEEWFNASVFSDHALRLTAAGLEELKHELHEVIARHAAETQSTEDAATVIVGLQAYPLWTD